MTGGAQENPHYFIFNQSLIAECLRYASSAGVWFHLDYGDWR